MSRRFVIGDIHGSYRALKQVIERSGIDKEKDRLICLGDVCDGWSEVKESIDLLLEFDDLVYILGNHDSKGPTNYPDGWALEWMKYGEKSWIWLTQGGNATYHSYGCNHLRVSESHKELLENAKLYHIEDKKKLFVHGGIPPNSTLQLTLERSPVDLLWDRDMYYEACGNLDVPYWDEVYCGHTQHKFHGPHFVGNVINMDSSAGWDGVLTLMDIDTKEWWISDNVLDLYPDEKGRF